MFLKGIYADDIRQLQSLSHALQVAEILLHITAEERSDVQWHLISKIKNKIKLIAI